MCEKCFTRCRTTANKYSKNRRKSKIWNFSVSDHNHSLNDDRFLFHDFSLCLKRERESGKIWSQIEKERAQNFLNQTEIFSMSHIICDIVYVVKYCLVFIEAIILIGGRTCDEESHWGLSLARNNSFGFNDSVLLIAWI